MHRHGKERIIIRSFDAPIPQTMRRIPSLLSSYGAIRRESISTDLLRRSGIVPLAPVAQAVRMYQLPRFI